MSTVTLQITDLVFVHSFIGWFGVRWRQMMEVDVAPPKGEAKG